MTSTMTNAQADTACGAEQGVSGGTCANTDDEGRPTEDLSAIALRKRVVKKAQIVLAVGLALCWMMELGSSLVCLKEKAERRMAVANSAKLDMLTGGTAFGAYPGSPDEIQSRWCTIARQDERQSEEEDSVHALHWLILTITTAGAGCLFFAPKGKAIVQNYIENGVPQ